MRKPAAAVWTGSGLSVTGEGACRQSFTLLADAIARGAGLPLAEALDGAYNTRTSQRTVAAGADAASKCGDELLSLLESALTGTSAYLKPTGSSLQAGAGPLAKNGWRKPDPIMTVAQDGKRGERFTNGAEVQKDAVGRVLSVRSEAGDHITFSWNKEGTLASFARFDRFGRPHSRGEQEREGVTVRDPQGRVLAVGDAMSVAPNGAFFVYRNDGQYSMVDLVSGLSFERKKVQSAGCSAVSAVFAEDGFRMVTQFEGNLGQAREASSGKLRFYGRDGSLIQFDCEELLKELRPNRVLPPGARSVALAFRRRRKCGTAWDAVREYLIRIS